MEGYYLTGWAMHWTCIKFAREFIWEQNNIKQQNAFIVISMKKQLELKYVYAVAECSTIFIVVTADEDFYYHPEPLRFTALIQQILWLSEIFKGAQKLCWATRLIHMNFYVYESNFGRLCPLTTVECWMKIDWISKNENQELTL